MGKYWASPKKETSQSTSKLTTFEDIGVLMAQLDLVLKPRHDKTVGHHDEEMRLTTRARSSCSTVSNFKEMPVQHMRAKPAQK